MDLALEISSPTWLIACPLSEALLCACRPRYCLYWRILASLGALKSRSLIKPKLNTMLNTISITNCKSLRLLLQSCSGEISLLCRHYSMKDYSLLISKKWEKISILIAHRSFDYQFNITYLYHVNINITVLHYDMSFFLYMLFH